MSCTRYVSVHAPVVLGVMRSFPNLLRNSGPRTIDRVRVSVRVGVRVRVRVRVIGRVRVRVRVWVRVRVGFVYT